MVSCFEGITPYPTSEMKLRGQAKSFVASVMVSSFSGISVAFATLSRRLTALIGNAISLSLLPPAVNSGQLLLLAVLAFMQKTVILHPMGQNDTLSRDSWPPHPRCVYPWVRNYEFIYMDNECDAAQEFAALSAFSFLLVTMNILVILVTGYTVNKLKDMAPRAFTNETVRRFYQKDLPEFRKTYHCLHKLDAAELATCAYKEYLRLNRVNPESDGELDPEESERIASEFRAVLQGVGKNHHVQTVSAKADFGGQFLKSFLSHSELLAGQRRHPSRANTTYHASWLENGKIISMAKMYHTTHDKPVQFGGDFEEALQRRRLTETWMDRATTMSTRLRQLELLGEVDSESESHERTSRRSSKHFITPKDQNQCQNVGKFHVVPTQLSMSRMGSANDKAILEERV
ncbi:unnamed protein product [Dicrocoelium dendriticum]|nr:unnamed protein product [Dicrocoelium dendriticum]